MDLNDLLKNPDQIKGLIQVLQSLLPTDVQEEPRKEVKSSDETVDKAYINPTIKTKGRFKEKTQSQAVNKFDQMSEFNMHKEDAAIDKILSKVPPVARVRDEISPVSVVCRICGKTELVNPSLIFESIGRYKCNSCSTQAG